MSVRWLSGSFLLLSLTLLTWGLLAQQSPEAAQAVAPDSTGAPRQFDLHSPEVRARLTAEQYRVAVERGTEAAFSNAYWDHHEAGTYECVVCGEPLFDSATKFDSGTGWPSFSAPISSEAVAQQSDTSHGMSRDEVVCPNCGAHLGHLFDDGPAPTGLRYCMNSASMNFVPRETASDENKGGDKADSDKPGLAEATFGGGCFWGVEESFRNLSGVVSTEVGFEGGTMDNPSYYNVCADGTGHAEVVHILYDPSRITYGALLEEFWDVHDPTQVDRQGPDVGEQYRSVIFTHSPEQEAEATEAIEALTASGRFRRRIATEIVPASTFWRAEDYHQQYLAKQGLAVCH